MTANTPGVIVLLPQQRLQQQTAQPLFTHSPELGKPDDHAVVAGARLCAVGAEQPVPDGEVEAVVAVRFLSPDGVVHPVHVWSDHERSHCPVERRRQPDVAMREQGRGVEQDLERDDRRPSQMPLSGM